MAARIQWFFASIVAAIVLAACSPTPGVTYDLNVTIDGEGSVVSTPEGIDSETDALTASFDEGTEVTLEATAEQGYTFDAFSVPADADYDCEADSTDSTCVLTMDGAKSVTATFTEDAGPEETLTVAIDAPGTSEGNVTSDPAGIDTAAGDESASFPIGSTVELTASATTGGFAGWVGGDCDGSTDAVCSVEIDEGEPSVTATFTDEATLDVSAVTGGSAEGNVTSDPAGIDTAAGDDSATFAIGSTVELTASATTEGFAGWVGGDCDGQRELVCTVTIDVDEESVIAGFNDEESVTQATQEMGDDAVELLQDSPANPGNNPEGWIWADWPRIDLGVDKDNGPTETGLRFQNISVPEGARVQSAVLRFMAYEDETFASPIDLSIRGQAELDPDPFPQDADGDPSFDITARTTRTSASTSWRIGDTTWVADETHDASDAAAVLQEIVDLDGWEGSSQTAVFFINADDPSNDENPSVYSFDGAGQAPTLLIEYVAMPDLP